MKKTISAPYYNIGQLRVDYWNDLKKETSALSHAKKGTDDEKNHKKTTQELLKELSGVECFFSFPGKMRLEQLKETLKRQEYTSLMNKVTEIARLLVSDSHRSHLDFAEEREWGAEELEKGGQVDDTKHFDVMIVEDMSLSEEMQMRHKLSELRDPKEPFTYGVVVQRSFQDALIALLFNHNIQAVVIRYAPPFHSEAITPLIAPYIQNALMEDLAATPEEDLGPILGKMLKQFRPELDTYYVTDTSLADLKDSTLKSFRRIFYHKEDL